MKTFGNYLILDFRSYLSVIIFTNIHLIVIKKQNS